jgi:hypothetical protein
MERRLAWHSGLSDDYARPMTREDPLDETLRLAAERRERYRQFLEGLRASDPSFAEASVLQADDMNEWQGAVYLLTGNDEVWRAIGGAVLQERSIGPVVHELEQPRRAWSSSQRGVMIWAAHMWDVNRHEARFPYSFEAFLFNRWITALHLRHGSPPALSITTSRPG